MAAITLKYYTLGGVPEWPKGADCKSAGGRLRRFKSFSLHHRAEVAQLVEHNLAKVGVAGSSPVFRSIFLINACLKRGNPFFILGRIIVFDKEI